jgi:GT2 family glycosyltransferase
MRVTVIILTYQSVQHLDVLLPTVVLAHNVEGIEFDVVVVENGSDVGSENLINKQFPEFHHQYAASNDYLFSLNPVVEKLNAEYVVILNDDMSIEDFGIAKAVSILDDHPDFFGVNLRMTDWSGQNEQSAVRDLSYRNGYYTSRWRPDLPARPRYTLYPGGGSGVFRRSMFVELGGFSRLYYPAYAEDMDLGWRAWHRGWPSVFLPDSWIRHKEGGTLEEQMPSNLRTRQIYANRISCMLRNGTMPGFRAEFFLRLPSRLLMGAKNGGDQTASLIRALINYPEVLKARRSDPEPIISDSELIQLLGKQI